MADVADLIKGWTRGEGMTIDVGTMTGFVELLGGTGRGGGTRRAATLLGLPMETTRQQESSMRAVQRRMVYESGAGTRGGAQARPERATTPEKIREAAQGLALPAPVLAALIRRGGIRFNHLKGTLGNSEHWEYGRVVDNVPRRGGGFIPGADRDLRRFAATLQLGNYGGAARILRQVWSIAYTGGEDVMWGPEEKDTRVRSGGKIKLEWPQLDELHVTIRAEAGAAR